MSLVTFALMIVFGASFTMMGPLMPDILKHYGLSLAGGGGLVSMQNLSGIFAIILCGLFGDRLNKIAFIALGTLLFGISLLGIGSIPPYGLLMALFFVLGLGSRSFDTLANAVFSDIHGEHRLFFLNLLHSFFAVGAFLGPMIVYAVSRSGLSWHFTFVILGCAALVVFLLYIPLLAQQKRHLSDARRSRRISNSSGTVESSKPEDAKATEPVSTKIGGLDSTPVGLGILPLFARWRMWVLGFLIFIHMGVMGILITWMPLYVGGTTGGGVFLSGFSLSAFWIGIIISRSLLSRLSLRFGEIPMIRWGGLASAVLFGLALLSGDAVLITIGSVLTGMAIGFTIPFIMSIGCHWFPEKSAAVTSMMFVFGYMSVVVYPWVTGLLGDSFGLAAAMILFPVSQVATFAVSWMLRSED